MAKDKVFEQGIGRIAPIQLKMDYRSNPVGVDHQQPIFSWQLKSDSRSQRQRAYRVLVAAEKERLEAEDEPVWDSGKVPSDETLNIRYGGIGLRAGCTYFWKVMVWDKQDTPSGWSETAAFEMGLLEARDWEGSWIGGHPGVDPLEGAYWIQYPGQGEETDQSGGSWYFRKEFDIPDEAKLQQVLFDGTAVDEFELYVNGTLVRKTNTDWKQDWTSPFCYTDLTDRVAGGTNCLACRVMGKKSSGQGLVGKWSLRFADREDIVLVTDDTWKVSDTCWEGWTEAGFFNDGWLGAEVQCVYGDGTRERARRRGRAPLLRREFGMDREIARARLYICGLGYYELFLNGMRVGNSVLEPGYTQYNKRVFYSTYDVGAMLAEGQNCIGVELGRGYYAYQKDWIGLGDWIDEPKLLLQLNVQYRDGTTGSLFSDASWKAADGPTMDDSIWYGDKYDARFEQPGWACWGFDDSRFQPVRQMTAPLGRLRTSQAPPVQILETLEPVTVHQPRTGLFLYDMGKVTAGWARITVEAERGTRIKMTYGEKLLPDGSVDIVTKGAVYQFWEPPQVDMYVCRGGGTETWEPRFSYKGFRYVEVEGLPSPIRVEGRVLHNTVEETGSFHCSNPLLNRIHQLVTPTILNNLHSIPTDTPMYEKRGWTGDAQVISETAMLNLDMSGFFRKWVQDLEDSQGPMGEIPDTCPGPAYYPPAPEWMCAFVVVPWNLYKYYGDIGVLQKHYSSMKRYLEYEIRRMDNWVSSDRHYGDWCSPEGSPPPEGAALSATLYVYHVCDLMGKIAEVLGLPDDVRQCAEWCGKIRDTVNTRFFDPVRKMYHTDIDAGYRQTSNVLPLAFGIVPEPVRPDVAANLSDDVLHTRNGHLDVGCYGLKYLAPVLTEQGFTGTAYKMATQTTYPSWGYWLANGATTCWEGWDLDSRSYDHYFLGTIDEWFYRYLTGIETGGNGYKTIIIKPFIPAELESARARLQTVRGEVSSEWVKEGGRLTLTVTIPPNTTAEVYIPGSDEAGVLESGIAARMAEGVEYIGFREHCTVYRLESGSYVFVTKVN